MRRRLTGRFQLTATAAAAVGFLAGTATTVALAWRFADTVATMLSPNGAIAGHPAAQVIGVDDAQPAAANVPAPPAAYSGPALGADPIADLRGRHLEVPVQGVRRAALIGSFDALRDATHLHHAIDILAPRSTPIVAVEDGTIARLFLSVPGGITIYQFDPSARYEYYYAHLERYADGLAEGAHVTRTQVIGYVGTSGNAPKDTPHLHFEIGILTGQKQWWRSTPIDPYRVLR